MTELTTPIQVRVSQDLLRRIDEFRSRQPGGDTLSLSQAMRMLMELGLNNVEKRKRFRE